MSTSRKQIMKIQNHAIVAALQRAAHLLNVPPATIVEELLSEFAERMQDAPSEFISEFSTCFPHRTELDAEIAAERIAELAASDAREGKTELTVACEVVEDEGGFLVAVSQLHPASGRWQSSDGSESGSPADEDGADWWKSIND
jgi:hypothetical protein